METCLKIAPTCLPVEDRQYPRLAIDANRLPIRGAYLSFLSLFQLKSALLWLFTIPSVSTQGAYSAYSAFGAHFFRLLRPFTIPSVSHQDLLRLVRTFLQARRSKPAHLSSTQTPKPASARQLPASIRFSF